MHTDGWIILDKDSGLFSRTAGGRIMRMLGAQTFGHIGTLDPMASGVLPIAIGRATKMIPFIEELPGSDTKEYLFSIRFGFLTDTLDITGRETMRDDKTPSEDDLNGVLMRFIGKIEQVPPAYSAVHVGGRRAYEMVRSGHTPDMKPRGVEIYALEYLGRRGADYDFRVQCSRGTYVRSLARDIAAAMGTLGVASAIRRTRTGQWSVKNAVKLDFLENLVNNGGDVGQYLHPTDFGLGDIPVVNLDAESAILYSNGGFIKMDGCGTRRVYSGNEFIGIGHITDGTLRPKRTI